MKQLLVLFSALVLVSCNKFKLEGKATGIKDGTKVFLVKTDSLGMQKQTDTVVLKDGKFTFEGKAENLELAMISFDQVQNGSSPFILENGTISFDFNFKFPEKTQIGGTKNNDFLQEYNKKNIAIQQRISEFVKPYKTILPTIRTKQMQGTKLTDEEQKIYEIISKEGAKFQDETNKTSKDFVKNNPNSFISVLLMENLSYRGVITDFKEVKVFYEKLDNDLKNTFNGKKIKKFIDSKMKTEKKSKAPDFSAKTPEGKIVSLKQSLGKVTIVDFWASWCQPCRKENPNMVALYNDFHSKGLNIIGVSLDDKLDNWKTAIAKDKLTWTHVSNLSGWNDKIALAYGVDGIPATFILDENGKIIEKGLSSVELRKKITELLK